MRDKRERGRPGEGRRRVRVPETEQKESCRKKWTGSGWLVKKVRTESLSFFVPEEQKRKRITQLVTPVYLSTVVW